MVYMMLPIIHDVAIKNGIRPERPMAASSMARQMGISASPVSVAIVPLRAFLAKAPAGVPIIGFATLLLVTIPLTLFGMLMIDMFFRKPISTPEGQRAVHGETPTMPVTKRSTPQWTAVGMLAAAIGAMVPVGLAIGVPPGYMVAFAAACCGYDILPSCPSGLATIQFDRSGTTHIGKYVINHRFIGPGLIGVSSSCLAGYLLALAGGQVPEGAVDGRGSSIGPTLDPVNPGCTGP